MNKKLIFFAVSIMLISLFSVQGVLAGTFSNTILVVPSDHPSYKKICPDGTFEWYGEGRFTPTALDCLMGDYTEYFQLVLYENDAFPDPDDDIIYYNFWVDVDCSSSYTDYSSSILPMEMDTSDVTGSGDGPGQDVELQIQVKKQGSGTTLDTSNEVSVLVVDNSDCGSGACCDLNPTTSNYCKYKSSGSQPNDISDFYFCEGYPNCVEGTQWQGKVMERDYYCTGGSSYTNDDSECDSCDDPYATACTYCKCRYSSCYNYASDKSCGIVECDGLDEDCRNYNDVTKYCNGAGSCTSETCDNYTNDPIGTSCGGAYDKCDGSGNCIDCECNSGSCCGDGCYFDSSSKECGPDEYESKCENGDVYARRKNQHCSEISSSCDGSYVYTGWWLDDECEIDEECVFDGQDASCQQLGCSCSWNNDVCGGGSCSSDKMQIIKSCNYDWCTGHGDIDCITHASCDSGSVCGDGICESGENCPEDATDCTDNKCYEPTCTNGCGQTAVSNHGTDEACDSTKGCSNPPCECNGAGSCVDISSEECDSTSYTPRYNAYVMANGETKNNMCGYYQWYKITTTKTCDIKWTLNDDISSNYDLYVKWDGSYPATTYYDCRPRLDGEEFCGHVERPPGTYYAMAKMDDGGGAYNIKADIYNCCGDECSAGERACIDDNNYKKCGNYDSDSCLEWSSSISCSAGERCVDSYGKCKRRYKPITVEEKNSGKEYGMSCDPTKDFIESDCTSGFCNPWTYICDSPWF